MWQFLYGCPKIHGDIKEKFLVLVEVWELGKSRILLLFREKVLCFTIGKRLRNGTFVNKKNSSLSVNVDIIVQKNT